MDLSIKARKRENDPMPGASPKSEEARRVRRAAAHERSRRLNEARDGRRDFGRKRFGPYLPDPSETKAPRLHKAWVKSREAKGDRFPAGYGKALDLAIRKRAKGK